MKEIIKKIVIVVLVAAIAIGVAVKFIKGDEPAVDGTTTTAAAVAGNNKNEGANADSGSNGNSNGSENALPTDSQGNVNTDSNSNGNANSNSGSNADSNVNANSNGNSNSGSNGNSNSAPNGNSNGNSNAATNNGGSVQNNSGSSDNGSAVQGTTGGQSSSQGTPSQTPSYEGNGNAQQTVTQSGQIAQPDNGNAQVNAQQPQQYANKIDVYQQIFASGKFIMKINDPDLGPVTMGMNGNKMFIDASMEGVTLKMLYDGDKPDKDNPNMGTWYIVIDEIKKYSPMPADMLGDMEVEDLIEEFSDGSSNSVYTKSTETIGGQTYDCESHVDENGNTTKYYFKGDVLVRSDSVSPSGEVSTTEFQEISGNVDDSLFEIPAGYAKFDISWLLNMVA